MGGRAFLAAYAAEYHAMPDPVAVYGYEAMKLAIHTISGLGIDGDNEATPDGFLGFMNLVNIEDFSYFNPTRFRFTNEVGEVYIIDEKDGLKSMSAIG